MRACTLHIAQLSYFEENISSTVLAEHERECGLNQAISNRVDFNICINDQMTEKRSDNKIKFAFVFAEV